MIEGAIGHIDGLELVFLTLRPDDRPDGAGKVEEEPWLAGPGLHVRYGGLSHLSSTLYKIGRDFGLS